MGTYIDRAAAQTKDIVPPPAVPPPLLSDAEREPVAYPPKPPRERALSLPSGTPETKTGSLDETEAQATETASVFEYAGGEHLAQVTTDPQNFQDADGQWRKIDPELEPTDAGYRNRAGEVSLVFPDALSATTPLMFGVGDGSLSIYPEGASEKVQAEVAGNAATYPEALPGTDLRYYSLGSGYAEHVILKTTPEATSMAWLITATDLTLRQNGAEIEIVQGEEVVGRVPPLTVFDASVGPNASADAYAGGFERTLIDQGDGVYRIEVAFDTEWLADPDRAYPVTIDPYFEETTGNPSKDAWVKSCPVAGGASTNRSWEDAVRLLARRIVDLREGWTSPLSVNVIYQIPGEVIAPEFEGVRSGRFSQRERGLVVQVALPAEPDGPADAAVIRYLAEAVEVAEGFARERGLIKNRLSELRAILAAL